LGSLSKGIRNTLRFMAGVYLLLNLCVATIPRCDSILSIFQHGLTQALTETSSCHDHALSQDSAIQSGHLCECTLVKYVFVTLPNYNPQAFIGFRVQNSTLIQFDYIFAISSNLQGPEPPYPRWNLVS
jgi:hypothetical protein